MITIPDLVFLAGRGIRKMSKRPDFKLAYVPGLILDHGSLLGRQGL